MTQEIIDRLAKERDEAQAEVERLKGYTVPGYEQLLSELRVEVARLTPLAHVTGESSYKSVVKRLSDEVERLKRELAGANGRCEILFDAKNRIADKLRAELTAECERTAKLRAEVERLKYEIARDEAAGENYHQLCLEWNVEVERLKLQLSIYTEAENNFSKLKHAYRIERERAAKLLGALEYVAEREHLTFAECADAEAIVGKARDAIAEYKGDKA